MSSRQYVVIMAGGGGTRLWPHSRRTRPKQFLAMLPSGETLIGATVRRTRALAPLADTLIVTTAEQVPEVRRAIPELPLGNILVEPIGRNTAPCIGLAALEVKRRSPFAIMAVLPSDHFVEDEPAFVSLLEKALAVAKSGHIVTLGVRPTGPETGYGYIRLTDDADADGTRLAAAFVEKPSHERACEYVAAGNYLWNSGMFFFPAQRILSELRLHLPPLGAILDEINAHPEQTAVRYSEAPPISIDYAVMEKLGAEAVGRDTAIRVIGGEFGWNDVGSFTAAAALFPADSDQNHVLTSSTASAPILIDSHKNLVWSSSRQVVAALGVEGLCIAVTDDAVLILPQARAQEVREVVARLQKSGRGELL